MPFQDTGGGDPGVPVFRYSTLVTCSIGVRYWRRTGTHDLRQWRRQTEQKVDVSSILKPVEARESSHQLDGAPVIRQVYVQVSGRQGNEGNVRALIERMSPCRRRTPFQNN